ncbi:MAG TPA: carbonic anhydrase [Thermomicrobiales bacterium]|nr:carbonic anhydrase [Thermomicrobiales bacterium]
MTEHQQDPAAARPAASSTPATPRPSPDEALELLMAGNRRYVEGAITQDYSARRTALKEHAPIAAILGCGDARVGAELIFDRGPGDLFMVRVAGNFLSDYGLASLEFCVEFLQVPLLMVLGHTHCGAVTAAVDVVEKRQDLPGRLFVLIDALEPSVLRAKMDEPADLLLAATEENVRRQVRRLETISPVINAAREAGRVKIAGGIYDIDTGKVTLLDQS